MANIDIRKIDGTDNQPQDLGQANDLLIRLFEPAYEDGYNAPRGGFDSNLPNPREISNVISDQEEDTGNPLSASDWLWQWGQFIDHDLSLNENVGNPEAVEDPQDVTPIPIINPDDPLFNNQEFTENGRPQELPFIRVPAAEGTGVPGTPRQQENQLTSFIDGSQGYGSELERAAAKRTDLGNSFFGLSELEETPPRGITPFDGKLLVANDDYNTNGDLNPEGGDPFNESGEILLPYNRARPGSENASGGRELGENGFITGDIRVNEQLGLISVHTLFVREHNLLVDKIASNLDAGEKAITELYQRYRDEYVPSLNLDFEPSEEQIRGEFLYEAARAVIGAKTQVITYKEFLPLLIGKDDPDSLETIDSDLRKSSDPRISNEFANAAFRVGHTLLNEQLRTIDPNGLEDIPLADAFFNPDVVSENGVDRHLIGLSYQQANNIDNLIVDAVREFSCGTRWF